MGDFITEYGFYDAGGGSGHLTLNGATEPDDQWVDGSLANIQYVGGSSPGNDTIYEEVYDATTGTWSASSDLTATTKTPHVAPTVNVQNASVAENTSIAASSVITSVTNPSGDLSMTEYGFYDAGGGSGHLTLNGATEPDDQWVDGSPANIQYVGGSSPGNDSIDVEVYDATTGTWSASSDLTATTTAPPSPTSTQMLQEEIAAASAVCSHAVPADATLLLSEEFASIGFYA